MSATTQWQGRKWIRDEKRLAIYLRDGLCCAYCGATVEEGASLSLDHVRPRSKGGRNEAANLVTCCCRCNSSRQDRPLAAWLRAVAEYRGMDEAELARHVRNCRSRQIDVAGAKKIIARRGGLTAALASC